MPGRRDRVSDDSAIFAQRDAGVRFEWGLAGAKALSTPAAAMVIVDVLSFTTAVTIAVERGTVVFPHHWPSPDIAAFAEAHRAVSAVRRHEVDDLHPWSLSPAHLKGAPAADRLVLPSPNGSAIASQVTAEAVLAGCLRNAAAVARWLNDHGFGRPDHPAVIIAAGERWPDGQLRPGLEDLLGAGAVIAALRQEMESSPEAAAAEAAWHAHRDHLAQSLTSCASAQKLIHAGYPADVTLAAEVDSEAIVPLLIDGAFRPTNPRSQPA
jgi:2-phosphosulfolactate phosphatase